MKYDSRTPPKAAYDEAASTTYTQDDALKTPPTAAKGDDEMMSTPGKKPIQPLL